MNKVINVINKPAIGSLGTLVKDLPSQLDRLEINNEVYLLVE